MNKRNAIILLVLLLAIGFAAVSTTLFINGTILFGTNEGEFTVIFTKAIVDDVDLSDTAISDDGKTITYETKELAIIGEESILDFTVKNNSTQYDAEININCIGGANEGNYYELEYDLPDFVAAQSEIDGYVKARMIRSSVNEIIEELTCTLNVTAMERTEAAEGIIDTVNPVVSYSDEDGDGALSLGDIVSIGDETIESIERFYVLSSDETNTKLLSMYNLYVGGDYSQETGTWLYSSYESPTEIQDNMMLGWRNDQSLRRGVTAFSSDNQKGTNYNDYIGSIVEGYVNNYSAYLTNTLRIENSSTLISKEELESIVESTLVSQSNLSTVGAPSWLYSTSYWTRTSDIDNSIWNVRSDGAFYYNNYTNTYSFGVRPVVKIDTELFETEEDNTVSSVSLTTDDNGNGAADLGEIISIGDEQFYVISNDGTNIKMLARYNLYVGGENTSGSYKSYTNPTGIQDSTMLGMVSSYPYNGVTAFSSDSQKGTNLSDYSGSIVEGYVNNYSNYLLNTLGVENTATLISKEELEEIVGSTLSSGSNLPALGAPSFLYSTSYWTRSAISADNIWWVGATNRNVSIAVNSNHLYFGVRPLVTISADLI